jgi:pimeloyl-ACP methyl ester carboxylesterase
MTTTLVCLHGFTQNGTRLRARVDALARQLSPQVEAVYPDAPHACSQAGVDRLYAGSGIPLQPPPYLCWWDASDDGHIYRGWETTRDRMRELCTGHNRLLVLGFSQGAMLAAALAGLSAAGDFPAIAGVVLVAGGIPRSKLLRPLFETPIRVPSLHVWGERDVMARAGSPALVEAFAADKRELAIWPGPHAVPTRGPAANAIVQFLQRDA